MPIYRVSVKLGRGISPGNLYDAGSPAAALVLHGHFCARTYGPNSLPNSFATFIVEEEHVVPATSTWVQVLP